MMSTRWATPKEIAEMFPSPASGDACANFSTFLTASNRHLKFGATNAAVIGGSGSGKRSAVINPAAATWNGTLIVLENDARVRDAVMSQRRSMGQRIFDLRPESAESPDRLDPFSLVDWDSDNAITHLHNVLECTFWRDAKAHSQFFHQSAVRTIVAAAAYLKWSEGSVDLKSLANFFDGDLQLALAEAQILSQMQMDEARKSARNPLLSTACSGLIGIVSSRGDLEKGAMARVLMTVRTYLHAYHNPILQRTTGNGTFTIDDVLAAPSTVFIQASTEAGLEVARWIVDLLCAQAMQRPMHAEGGKITLDSTPVFLVMPRVDLVKLGCMESYHFMRASRIYMLFGAHNIDEVHRTYGRHIGLLENTRIVIAMRVTDSKTANYLSKRCGTTDIERDVIVERRRRGIFWETVKRREHVRCPLISWEEIVALTPDDVLLLSEKRPALVKRDMLRAFAAMKPAHAQ